MHKDSVNAAAQYGAVVAAVSAADTMLISVYLIENIRLENVAYCIINYRFAAYFRKLFGYIYALYHSTERIYNYVFDPAFQEKYDQQTLPYDPDKY